MRACVREYVLCLAACKRVHTRRVGDGVRRVRQRGVWSVQNSVMRQEAGRGGRERAREGARKGKSACGSREGQENSPASPARTGQCQRQHQNVASHSCLRGAHGDEGQGLEDTARSPWPILQARWRRLPRARSRRPPPRRRRRTRMALQSRTGARQSNKRAASGGSAPGDPIPASSHPARPRCSSGAHRGRCTAHPNGPDHSLGCLSQIFAKTKNFS